MTKRSLAYFMDRWWYRRLLYGAVSHGMAIEAELKDLFPKRGLTASSDARVSSSGYKAPAHIRRRDSQTHNP
jgi:hypothetical protein